MALDTSAPRPSAAVWVRGQEFYRAGEALGHFEQVSDLVNSVRQDAGLDWDSLERVVVGDGPGSFTGLRIGLGYAKGVALAQGCAIEMVSSLKGAAHSLLLEGQGVAIGRRVIVLVDAGRGESFVEAGEIASNSEIRWFFGPSILADSEVLNSLEQVWRSRPEIEPLFVSPDGATLKRESCSAVHIARGLLPYCGQGRSASGVVEISAVEPSYIRAVAAKTIIERSRGVQKS